MDIQRAVQKVNALLLNGPSRYTRALQPGDTDPIDVCQGRLRIEFGVAFDANAWLLPATESGKACL